jgi:exopolysaccharide biosynthesis polyprenyl glycosylphosphotransferase
MAALVLQKVTRAVAVTDTLVLATTISVIYFLRFGTTPTWQTPDDMGILRLALPPSVQTGLILLVWLAVLGANRSRDHRIIGSDSTEYKRVVMSGFLVPVFLAFAALLFKVDVPRLYIAAVIFFGTLALLVNRWIWRHWLNTRRSKGEFLTGVALLGPINQVQALAQKISTSLSDGYQPIVLISDSGVEPWTTPDGRESFPQIGFGTNLSSDLAAHGCEALLVVGSQLLNDHEVKRIAWRLEGSGIDLVVVSPLNDVGTHRLEVRPLAGTPVFVVEVPRFKGWKHFVKGAFDVVFASFALMLLSPLLVVVALVIKAQDKGPVFFSHERYGLNGRTFRMLKFRSMRVGADKEFDQLKDEVENEGNAVQFKLKSDPRVTPFGKFIRKYSIDELPQFINVLRGEMSVVGPRPHVKAELDSYEVEAFRRLLVKPGLTGLWQVSGRSNLAWEEAIALDLNYVENWSVAGDLLLIARTLNEIVYPKGAF